MLPRCQKRPAEPHGSSKGKVQLFEYLEIVPQLSIIWKALEDFKKHISLTITLDKRHYLHFRGEEIVAQRGSTCLNTQMSPPRCWSRKPAYLYVLPVWLKDVSFHLDSLMATAFHRRRLSINSGHNVLPSAFVKVLWALET